MCVIGSRSEASGQRRHTGVWSKAASRRSHDIWWMHGPIEITLRFFCKKETISRLFCVKKASFSLLCDVIVMAIIGWFQHTSSVVARMIQNTCISVRVTRIILILQIDFTG